ncbi:SRPBCC domain-containing protein [Aeromicrobium phragmitis]|uniref:SRPBCC domain-containing protein n=1 Tax=Aeromicrobium phragmitis TaxID=2478914 RepID=A0A3L8PHP6_9ACTN|nr:SRPBCC domain-containing protein [Aeromicrobium phragmitis]RLV54796.1 SRPBCC domain-containing protein [Aeromicrobium phragmitis]
MNTTDASATQAPEFSITRVFDAPLDLVWRAWTEDAELANWLHPFGVTTDSVSFDVRVGGRYRYTMTNDETGEQFPTGGEYLDVQPMERLVFTWGEPDAPVEGTPVITLTLTPQGDRTELVFHLRGHAGEPGDGYVYDGWDEALANFGRHLAGERLR